MKVKLGGVGREGLGALDDGIHDHEVLPGRLAQALRVVVREPAYAGGVRADVGESRNEEGVRDCLVNRSIQSGDHRVGAPTPWITIVGIIVLSAGGAPEAVGIGLIAGGILSTRALTSNRSVAQR